MDGRFFAIDDRGQFSFSASTPPDFEQPGDAGGNNVYEVEIQASDGINTGSLAVTVTVREVDEGPEVSGPSTYTIDENQSLSNAVYTATDPEGDTVTRWTVGGRDGGDFTITETGVLTFRNVPDYERPADSNRDNVYEVQIRPYDGRHYGAYDVTVSVTDVNEAPTITTISTSATALRQDENRTSRLYTYRATDPEGGTITWTVGGVDGRFFAIDERGQFAFSASTPPDFEQPGDAGGNNVYEVEIEASDGLNTGSLAVTVTVREVDEGPEVSGQSTYTIDENQSLSNAVYTATDPEGDTVTRWTVGGRDGGDFTITETGVLTFRNVPDYDKPADSNRDNVYEVQIRPYDGRHYGAYDVTVTVTDVNEAPTITTISTSATALRQNENRTSRLYTYRATDPEGSTITWTVGGVDRRFFAIDERGRFSFSASTPPDFEQPGDAGGNNVYEVEIEASDGLNTGSLAVTVTVREVDEGPVVSGTASFTISENQNLTGATFTGRDPEVPDAEVTDWRLSGSDAGDFTITDTSQQTGRNTAELTFRNIPDFDRPADSNRDNEYVVTIRAYNGSTYGSLDVTVTVTDQNEAEPVVSGRDSLRVSENYDRILSTYSARDMDRGTTFAWSVRGADGREFAISDSGALTFARNPNYERPADADADNVYEITIVASDGANEGSLGVSITVTDVNEGPEITGPGSHTVSESFDEVLATYSATDPEDATAEITRWSVTGRDGGDFTINEAGELTFRNAPDFEGPADSNRDNDYEVTVRASDGRVNGTFGVTVVVEDVNEAPEFRSGSKTSFTYRENGTSALYTYRATDPEQGAVSWSLRGDDAGDFLIGETGSLTFASPPDFDRPAGSGVDGNDYLVTVVVTDDGTYGSEGQLTGARLERTLEVTVTVSDVNEGPEIEETSTNTAITVRENHDQVLSTYSATDPEDPGAEITRWSLSGRDGGDFTINEAGALSFRNPPDVERPADSNRDNTYAVTVRASDGRYYGTLNVTVTVEAVDEAPEFRRGSQDAFAYQENETSAIYTYRATDPEGSDVTWGIAGIDRSAFTMSATGVLAFNSPPDYESPADSGSDNVYELTVEARDENNNTAGLAVTVTVTNVTDVGVPSNVRVTRHESGQLRVFWKAPDSGTPPDGYTVQWKESSADWTDDADVSEEPVTDTSHIIKGLTDGVEYDVRVIASKNATESAPSKEASATPEETAPATPNSPATGAPTISGTAQVGEELTADVSGIADADGLDNATFAYQWIADDTAIQGAIGSTYTLTDGEEGKAIKVRVSLTDDADYPESLTSVATAAVAAAGLQAKSATVDGSTLTLTYEENLDEGVTLPASAFTVTVNGGGRAVNGVSVSGTTVNLTLASAVAAGETVKVGYAKPDGPNFIRDTLGREGDSFSDHAVTNNTPEALPQQQEAVNTPATGAPTISGTAQVGETLTADTSAIADEDGLENATFSYQWVRVDGRTETDISNAMAPAYHPTTDDVGKTIKVNVSFTDDAGHSEGPLGSAVTDVVEDSDRVQVLWTATMTTAAETGDPAKIGYGDPSTYPESSLVPSTFVVGSTTYTFREVAVDSADLVVHISPQLSATDVANWRFLAGATEFMPGTPVNEPDLDYSLLRWVEADLHWNAGDRIALAIRVVNNAATGAPSVTGTAQVGETLAADLSGITDADGKPSDAQGFGYQWVRVDGRTATEIAGATAPRYSLADADVGKTIKVTVSFTDLAGFSEGPLTSDATDPVMPKPSGSATGQPTISGTAQVGETLTANTSGIADADGLDDATFSYQWIADDSDIAGATGSTYALAAADEGKVRVVKVRVRFTDDRGHAETLTSTATVAVAAKPSSPATGQPAITGTAEVGETLTADTSGIADADGLDNVSFSYQWIADDSDIAGATGSTYALAAADESKVVKVRVSFTDDAGNAESLTSGATDAVAGLPSSPLTARLENTPQSHDGQTTFTFELRFSEHLADLSYITLRDDAFTVTGGQVTKARRMDPDSDARNIHWEISVTPDGNGAVTIVLPATTDCDDSGAVCTSDGRMLSTRLELAVSGPGG